MDAGLSRRLRLNALAGIFCFGDNKNIVFAIVLFVSQCPRGHFLFWGPHGERDEQARLSCVSMPSRAFFVLGVYALIDKTIAAEVSMPSRAFFVLGASRCEKGRFKP